MKKTILILICFMFSFSLAFADHGTKNEKKAHGHQFFFSACFPHYNPQIMDFITRKLQ